MCIQSICIQSSCIQASSMCILASRLSNCIQASSCYAYAVLNKTIICSVPSLCTPLSNNTLLACHRERRVIALKSGAGSGAVYAKELAQQTTVLPSV